MITTCVAKITDIYSAEINYAIKDFFKDISPNYKDGIMKEAHSQLEKLILKSGNRIRSNLIILTSKAYRTKIDHTEIIKTTIAFELLKSYFCMNNETLDCNSISEEKQRIKTYFSEKYSKEFGNSMKILLEELASALVPMPILSANIGVDKQIKIISMLSYLKQSIISGQVTESHLEFIHLSHSEIFNLYKLKTASHLVQYPLLVGAVLGNSNETQQKLIFDAGASIGIAYQIQKDLNNLFGKSKITRRPVGIDIIHGKRTYPIHCATDVLGEDFKKKLKKVFGNDDADITEIKEVLNEMSIPSVLGKIKKEKQRLIDNSIKSLNKTTMDKKYLELIIQTLRYIVDDLV